MTPAPDEPHETALVRQVIAAVPEYLPTTRKVGRYIENERKPHDVTVTEAVHATLAALGFTISLDGSIKKPPSSGGLTRPLGDASQQRRGNCCPHLVERHAYNGCADCGCAVRWSDHPDRDLDQSDAAREERLALAASRVASAVDQTARILDLALKIGEHWRTQEGVNGALLDELAQLTVEGTGP